MQRQQTGGRLKAALFMTIAVAIAALLAFIVLRTMQAANRQLEQARRGPRKVEVVAAANDLYMGIPITLEDLRTVEVLPDAVPTDLVFTNPGDVVGRTPRERILAGEVIREERLADPTAGKGLNAIITPGKRAMTIEADARSSLGGFLQPGNYVDVIVTIRPDDSSIQSKWLTETILQAVRVLAVGDTTVPGGEEKKKSRSSRGKSSRRRIPVTLELTLEEAEKLALASSRGDLHLVLRSDIDIILQDTNGPVNTNALLGVASNDADKTREVRARAAARVRRPAPKPPEEEPRNLISAEVIQGSETEEVKFDQESGQKIESDAQSTRNRRR